MKKSSCGGKSDARKKTGNRRRHEYAESGGPNDLLRLNGGERQHEDGPFTHFALHGNGAMMGFHNFFYDGEAEAMPARIPGASGVRPVKRLEEMR
jgi:hypothetical protein